MVALITTVARVARPTLHPTELPTAPALEPAVVRALSNGQAAGAHARGILRTELFMEWVYGSQA